MAAAYGAVTAIGPIVNTLAPGVFPMLVLRVLLTAPNRLSAQRALVLPNSAPPNDRVNGTPIVPGGEVTVIEYDEASFTTLRTKLVVPVITVDPGLVSVIGVLGGVDVVSTAG